MAASNPARLSVQAMIISSTPGFRRPLSSVAQNLALSFSPTHMPSTSFWPSSLSPLIDCFDGLVVNWTVGHSPNAALVNTMLDQAIAALSEGQHPMIAAVITGGPDGSNAWSVLVLPGPCSKRMFP